MLSGQGGHGHGEDPGEGSAQSTADEENAPVVKPTKKRGYRKATHTIRKVPLRLVKFKCISTLTSMRFEMDPLTCIADLQEETERLRAELAQLEAQMTELQRRALASSSQTDEADEEKVLHTHVLRHAVQQQQAAAVKIQALMTDYAACVRMSVLNIQAGSPIQRFIHLGKDEQTRRDTLRALKALKIQDAQSFFSRRVPGLDPLKSMSEDYRFENEEGDYWAARFATSQFERAQNVKQIFDLVVYYLCNIEISVSEKLGHITVREDDDNGEKDINQNRLVSVTNEGLHMESNTVVFSEYCEPEPGSHDGYGLIVADFVDEDERHPYRPDERVRKDVNTVMEVRSYKRRPRQIGVTVVDTGETAEETVVVLTRWSHSRLRHPTFPVTKVGWYELRDNMDRWSQNMHKTLMENLIPLSEDRPIWPTDG
ncbi:hypothetical protein BBJ28_00003208 [Nothophytophthora sp. Chile5]|nr:hypothetical protein BBJ28_00003208 [Nothophytophthora sp. Chile5]